MKHQSGAALIFVLFVLVLLTLVGAYSVRLSTSDLGVSTAAQIQDVMFQASELALAKIEADSRQNGNSLSPGNMRGYVLQDEKENREVVFCLRPQSGQLFTAASITERQSASAAVINSLESGYCDLSDKADFINQRGSAIVQIVAKKVIPPACQDEPMACDLELTATDDQEYAGQGISVKSAYMSVDAISALPSFNNNASAITDCFKQATDTIGGCLDGLNVPNETHFQQYESYTIGFDTLLNS